MAELEFKKMKLFLNRKQNLKKNAIFGSNMPL